MTMLYTQTEEEREREQVGKILEHLGRATKKSAAKATKNLEQMKAAGGVQRGPIRSVIAPGRNEDLR